MSLVLQSSGGGQITIQEPATASNFTQNLSAVDGTILTSASQSIPSAALPVGSVLQVVSFATPTALTTTSTSYVATPLTVSITPKFSTSKILVTASGNLDCVTALTQMVATIYRNSSNLAVAGAYGMGLAYVDNSRLQAPVTMQVLDSPATTSSTSYTVYVARSSGSGSIIFNNGSGSGNSAATITLMEIAG
jgi:hypothetical protein